MSIAQADHCENGGVSIVVIRWRDCLLSQVIVGVGVGVGNVPCTGLSIYIY